MFPAFLAKLENMVLIHQTSIMVTVSWMQTVAVFKGVSKLQFPQSLLLSITPQLCVITTDHLTSVQPLSFLSSCEFVTLRTVIKNSWVT